MIDVRPVHAASSFEQAFAVAADAVRTCALPCAVVGVSDARGTIAIRAFPGPTDRATADSIFFLASVTKPIVASAVMQLVDEGRLDLRAPISRYVPEFAGPGKDEVTPWHVLTHTAGIGDVDHDLLRRQRPPYRRMLERVCRDGLAFAPGTRFQYSSDSFYLLAETISRLTGMSFPEALRRRLLTPLAMVDTTFDPRSRRGRVLPVHGIALGNPLVRELTMRFLARATMPGGGLFGTTEDLLRFGRSLLPRPDGESASAGTRILSQAAIDEMSREQTAGILELREDGTGRDPRYALGWGKPTLRGTLQSAIGTPPDTDTVVPASPSTFTHGGASGTRLWIDPDRRLVFAFLSNEWEASDGPMYSTLAALYDAWDAIPSDPEVS